MNNLKAYDSRTILFHWISAAVVVLLWLLGQTIDFLPKGMPRITVRSLHITLGIFLAVLLVIRVTWRFGGGTKLPQAIPGFFGKLASGTHHFLYALMIAVVVIGFAAVWIRGDNLFNLFTVPAFDPSNKSLRHDVVELHGLCANILLILAGLHALVAIFHHWIMRDGILKRMWPKN